MELSIEQREAFSKRCEALPIARRLNPILVYSLADFHGRIQEKRMAGDYDTNRTVYRGVKDAIKYELIPNIGRPHHKWGKSNWATEEKEMFRMFRERALYYSTSNSHLENDWERLFFAQHYGLPTRLLDWSRNPLVALYFSVAGKHEGDSAVYVLKNKEPFDWRECKRSPLDCEKFEGFDFAKVIPPSISERIVAQSGLFTIHAKPQTALDASHIDCIVIPSELRREFKKLLHQYGIHEASIKPGFDGLCAHLFWLRTDDHAPC